MTGLPKIYQIIRSAKMHADVQELDGFPRSRWILSAGIQAESKIQHFHSPDISAMEQHLCILWDFSFASWTPRPPPLGGTSLTSLHRQALVFPVFVWLSITAASTSGILFSSGTQGKPNSATCSTKTSSTTSTPQLSLHQFS